MRGFIDLIFTPLRQCYAVGMKSLDWDYFDIVGLVLAIAGVAALAYFAYQLMG